MIPRRAFTLIEILVVLTIMAILAALLMPAIQGMRNQARTVETRKLMMEVAGAIDLYLGQSPRLGNDTAGLDFPQDPLRYLVRQRLSMTPGPFLELPPRRAATGPMPDGPFLPAAPQDAQHILDAWGEPLRFVVRQMPPNHDWTGVIEIFSSAGGRPPERHLHLRLAVTGDLDLDGSPDEGVLAGTWQWVRE